MFFGSMPMMYCRAGMYARQPFSRQGWSDGHMADAGIYMRSRQDKFYSDPGTWAVALVIARSTGGRHANDSAGPWRLASKTVQRLLLPLLLLLATRLRTEHRTSLTSKRLRSAGCSGRDLDVSRTPRLIADTPQTQETTVQSRPQRPRGFTASVNVLAQGSCSRSLLGDSWAASHGLAQV